MTLAEQSLEYIKCLKSPIYFLDTYGFAFNIKTKKISKINLFEYQKEVVKTFHNNQNTIVLKSRQCLPTKTLVDTPNGKIKISKLKKGDIIFSYNLEKNIIEKDIVSDQWCSGKIQCVNIFLKNGEVIESGENHPFYVKNFGWKNAALLTNEDFILNAYGDDIQVEKIELTKIKKCYDITVDKNENFLINGLVVHNTGLSVITAGYVAWRLCFNKDERILVVANNRTSAVRFLDTVKGFLQNMPSFLKPETLLTDNLNELKFSNGSFVKAVASGKQAGRGESLTMLVLDETAFIEYADDIWKGAGMALSATQGKCIMISTPFGTGGLYHSTWVEAEKRENDFVPFKIHWSEHPIFNIDLTTEPDEYGIDRQTSPWYKGECERLQHDAVKIAQELDLSFEGSASVVVPTPYVERQIQAIKKDNIKPICYFDFRVELGVEQFVSYRTNFEVYEKPKEKSNYIIGADVCAGNGSDYSTICVLDADTLEQVAEFQEKLQPDIFADTLFRVATAYNNAYVACEANNYGASTTLRLQNDLHYPYERIHHSKSVKAMFSKHRNFNIQEGETLPGFQTTSFTRPLIITCLQRYMREGTVKIKSLRLLNEFSTFIHKGDKPQHSDGFHDDLIFAFMIALYMRDTEFENVFLHEKITTAMLNSFSSNQKAFNGPSTSTNFNAGPEKSRIERDDDLSWLYGKI